MSDENFSVLRHGSLRRFWLARVATNVAFQMQSVAVGWQLYDLTSSPLDLGLVGLIQFIPALLFMLVAGQIADRYDRRLVLALSQTVEATGSAVLAVATFTGMIDRPLIFITMFVLGAARAFESTASQTLLPGIVPARHLPRSVAAIASSTQAANIAGPALGGLLYILGVTVVYSTCLALSVAATILVLGVVVERQPVKREPVTAKAVFAGITFIRNSPIVLGAMSLDLFAVLCGGAVALMPIFARDVFDAGPWGLGLMRAAPAFGALAITVVLARRPLTSRVGRIMFGVVTVFGLSTIVFALSTSLILTLIALVIMGAADMVSVVIRQTLVQLETPDHMRGRVSAVNALFTGTANRLGDFRAGLTAEWFGAPGSVLLGGVGILAIVLFGIKTFPALYRVERFPAARHEP